MGTAPKDLTDPRQRYFHGALDVSALGKNEPKTSLQTGNVLPPMEGTPSYNLRFNADLSSTGKKEIGVLARGCWFDANWLISHATITATAAVELIDPVTGSVFKTATIPLTAGAAGAVDLTPLAKEYIVAVNVTAAGAADETGALTMRVNPATPGWK